MHKYIVLYSSERLYNVCVNIDEFFIYSFFSKSREQFLMMKSFIEVKNYLSRVMYCLSWGNIGNMREITFKIFIKEQQVSPSN